MSFDFKRVSVSEVCELIVDCVNKTAPKVDYETPYKMIRTPNIRNGAINLDGCNFVTEDTYKKWTRRANVKRDDVLLTREAPMGEVGIVDFEDTVFLGQRIMQYRADKNKVCPKFLFYSFLSSDLRNQFYQHEGSGSVVSHIRVPDCLKFKINLPPLETQKRIASILWLLDQKIKNNSVVNQTLEQMAQALFKSWFVDFEPVKAKIAVLKAGGSQEEATLAAMTAISGKDFDSLVVFEHEQPEQYADLKATAELFPSAMQDSELGEIPVGWSQTLLSDLTGFMNGYAFKSKDWKDAGFPVVKIGSVKPNFVDLKNCSFIDGSGIKKLEKFEVFSGDILVGMTGYPGETGIVPETMQRVYLNQRVGKFIPLNNFLYSYVYTLVRNDCFKTFVNEQAHGSAQANISSNAILQYPVVKPNNVILQRFDTIILNLINLKLKNQAQTQSLENIRDTLLPKLLSGEITLPETEQAVSEATHV